MLRSRFQAVPDQFSKRLVPNNEGGRHRSKQDKVRAKLDFPLYAKIYTFILHIWSCKVTHEYE